MPQLAIRVSTASAASRPPGYSAATVSERFPPEVLGKRRELAPLFKALATLRTNVRLFDDVEELRWRGPTEAFEAYVTQLGETRLLARVLKAKDYVSGVTTGRAS